MTNYNVFNSSDRPVYTQQMNTYVSPGVEATPDVGAAAAGRLFSLTTGNIAVGSGSSLLLQVVNPAASGRTLYFSQAIGGTTAAASLILYRGGTLTGGTGLTPINNLFGSPITSVMTAQQVSGSITGGPVTVMSIPLTSGAYQVRIPGTILVPPGQSVTFSLGTGTLTGSINVSWWEF